MNAHDDASGGSRPSQPMMRAAESRALTAPQLEERRLIHRHESVREQADAFRELRTRLLAMAGDGGFVTLVAPVRHDCGGSFVARNLAAAFAFDESREALLIDCDATHPTQAAVLRIDADVGLMEYLDDEQLPLERIVYATGVPRMRAIPSGRVRELAGEAFSSLRMRMLIDSLRAHGQRRHLILDGPPVLGSPDARILSDLADNVVLVVGEARVARAAVDQAAASFPAEKFAGVVFNRRP